MGTPRNIPVARFAHQAQHLFVHVIDAAVAGPLDIDLLSDHTLTNVDYLLPVHGE
jgi:hypothetical protein